VLLAAQQHVGQSVDDAQHAGDAGAAAGTGQQAERDLRLADAQRRIVQGDAVVGDERQLAAAAQRRAVDGGHDGHAQRLDRAHGLLQGAQACGHLGGIVGGGADHVPQVAAGEERGLARREDHAGDGVALVVQACGEHGDDAVVVPLVAQRVEGHPLRPVR
jgi:hypothetical protein